MTRSKNISRAPLLPMREHPFLSNPLLDGATGKPLALTQTSLIDLVTEISKYLFTARSTMRIYSVILTGPPFAHGLLFRLTGYSQVVKPTTIRMTTKKA